MFVDERHAFRDGRFAMKLIRVIQRLLLGLAAPVVALLPVSAALHAQLDPETRAEKKVFNPADVTAAASHIEVTPEYNDADEYSASLLRLTYDVDWAEGKYSVTTEIPIGEVESDDGGTESGLVLRCATDHFFELGRVPLGYVANGAHLRIDFGRVDGRRSSQFDFQRPTHPTCRCGRPRCAVAKRQKCDGFVRRRGATEKLHPATLLSGKLIGQKGHRAAFGQNLLDLIVAAVLRNHVLARGAAKTI